MGDEGKPAELSANLIDIVEHSPLAIAVFDLEMRYVLHSARYLTEYGLEGQTLIGRSHYDVFPELPQRYRDVHQRCLAGASESAEAEPFTRSDGRVEWTNWDARPWRTRAGAIGGIVVMTEVITARKAAEAKLQEAHERLAEAQRLARIGYWERDLVSDVLTLSDEVHELVGVDPSAAPLSYADYLRAVPEEEVESVDERFREAIVRGGRFNLEHSLQRPDGTMRYLAIDGRVLHDEAGRPTRLVGAAQDVTERRLLEDQLRESQKLEATGRLAGGVAHDFNNILTAIFGFSTFALEAVTESHPAADDLREVIRAAEQARSLTQQLLSFSRRRTVVPRVLQINERVKAVEAMIRRILGEDISYSTHLASDLWNTRIDPNALEQVIVNLAVNARDAMPEGGRLTIETTNVTLTDHKIGAKGQAIPPGDYVTFMLSDNGVGMSEPVREHIFDPFYTTKGPGRGTGLGLSTCYGIIRQAHGFIWVYSEPGQGTTFKVYLPRVMAAKDVEVVAPVPAAIGGSETILLAEDNEQVRRLAVRTLQELGYRVVACNSAEEALESMGELTIDLLITDVILPGLNGKALAERVTEAQPNVRVLFMSGYSENAIVHHGVLEEGVELLQKPFSPPDLARRVREILERERSR